MSKFCNFSNSNFRTFRKYCETNKNPPLSVGLSILVGAAGFARSALPTLRATRNDLRARCFANLLGFEPFATFVANDSAITQNQKLKHPHGCLNFWLDNLYRFITDDLSNFSNLSIQIKAFQQKLKSENPEVFALLNS